MRRSWREGAAGKPREAASLRRERVSFRPRRKCRAELTEDPLEGGDPALKSCQLK